MFAICLNWLCFGVSIGFKKAQYGLYDGMVQKMATLRFQTSHTGHFCRNRQQTLSVPTEKGKIMNILCKMGFHKLDRERYVEVKRSKRKHKWHKNYCVCTRCGKLYAAFSKHKERRKDNERKAD